MRRMWSIVTGCGKPARVRLVRVVAAGAAALLTSSVAPAQSPPHEQTATWTATLSLGGYARGNRGAVRSWLAANGYGVPEPRHCGFDLLFRPVCDSAVAYPRVSSATFVGWTLGIQRRLNDRASVEVFGATEQSGSAIGRCDDAAVPKDSRCTDRFMTVDFGGASLAALGVVHAGRLHLGAGPAVLLANWAMEPAHLAGLWIDATYGGKRVPLFARAQYRWYQSASFPPTQHFSRFHPSTLFLGVGFTVTVDDEPR